MTESISKQKKRKNGSKLNKVLFYATVVLLPTLFLLYLLLSMYYNSHFFANTTINGVRASNQTVIGVQDAINSQVKSYVLTLEERNDITEQINGESINLHGVFDESIGQLLEEQNGFAWPSSIFESRSFDINAMLEYNHDLLKEQVNALQCFDKETMEKPVNARVSEYGASGYEVIPEENGTQVVKSKLLKEIQNAITLLEPTLSLEDTDCYVKPKITADDPALNKAVEKMNKIVNSKITYEFGSVTEVVDGEKISKWLSVNDKLQVKLDSNGIKEFVDYIGKNYNSFGRVRTFQSSYGEVLKIKGGDYGWWLNRGKEAKELRKLLLSGKQQVKEPAYFQTAQKYGKDDIGNTYVEINLTAQHLLFYYKGKMMVESDLVSGNISKNFGTPTGTYPVQYKENDATLVGEDYETPVKYWMPFNGNIGLHDAYWRDEFGKDIYLTQGSHGCINLPPAVAKKIFKYISRGIPVIVYELPGTENYGAEEEEEQIMVD